MFGNLGAFVNGNMFMGLFGADIGVKLAEGDQAGAARRRAAVPSALRRGRWAATSRCRRRWGPPRPVPYRRRVCLRGRAAAEEEEEEVLGDLP